MIRIAKLAVTTLLTVGALGMATGAAEAQGFDQPALRGSDHGVTYTTTLTPRGVGLVTTLDGGAFTAGSGAVTVADRRGGVIATVPSAFTAEGHVYGLTPRISADRHTLTLTPALGVTSTPAKVAQARLRFVDAAADLARHQYNAVVGAVIGLGFGALLGIPFFGFFAVPSAVAGAGIGALIGWALP